MIAHATTRNALELALGKLQPLVENALLRVENITGQGFADRPGFHGLAVGYDEALQRLRHVLPTPPPPELDQWLRTVSDEPFYKQLKNALGSPFSPIDYGLFLLALAPEYAPFYERVFGFLHDDVTRRRVTVELAVDIFAPTEPNKVLDRCQDSSFLLTEAIIELVPPSDGRFSWGAKIIRLCDGFARWLFGIRTLDQRLQNVATVAPVATHWTIATLPAGVQPVLQRLLTPEISAANGRYDHDAPPLTVDLHSREAIGVRLYVYGNDRRMNFQVAHALGNETKKKHLLVVDTPRLLATENSSLLLRLLFREASYFDYVVVFQEIDALHTAERQRAWDTLVQALPQWLATHVLLLGQWPMLPPSDYPTGCLLLEIPLPDQRERLACWQGELETVTHDVTATELGLLAERYTLTWTQIELAVAEATERARLRGLRNDADLCVTFDDLTLSACNQGSRALDALTNKITPKASLQQLVVPADVQAQLREIVARLEPSHRDLVLRSWGFARKHHNGLGVNALFAGPSGTGKTLAAEALAHAIRKELYKIDLTTVVSKYIGETEQKLEQIFRAGEASQAVLFFDEADSLLGKRSEVKDAHDRYANLEVSYLLQRMERYDGLIVLATNLPGNLDDAFLRRMASIVYFTEPEAYERRLLWEQSWPRDDAGGLLVKLSEHKGMKLEYDLLAQRFELTGGNIRNASIAAAFAAAARHRWFPEITMWDVLQAVRREFQKLGQEMSDEELGLAFFQPPPPEPPSYTKFPARNGHATHDEVTYA